MEVAKKKPWYFETEGGRTEAGDTKFEEWAMHCQPNQNDVDFSYYLSRSYRVDEVFVYIWDKYEDKLILETLSAEVRILDLGVFLQYSDNAT